MTSQPAFFGTFVPKAVCYTWPAGPWHEGWGFLFESKMPVCRLLAAVMEGPFRMGLVIHNTVFTRISAAFD